MADAIIPILTSLLIKDNTSTFDAASLDFNEWWGPPALQGNEDTSILPDPIVFEDKMIKDLKHRLGNHVKFQPPLENAAFTYGFNSDALEFFINYWAKEYPFKEREAYLNQFPQFKTNIQGLNIHFAHIKPNNPSNKPVLPLLILHGWPGSIREFYDAIPLLTADSPDRDFVVEVVAPCLPGFGFSDATTRQGLGAMQKAVILRNLMHRLGHEQFYLQGGDWGGIIGSYMVTIFPKEVLGFHANWGVVLSAVGLRSLIPFAENILAKTGYLHLAATKPDTYGMAFSDSPAGTLTFVLDGFSSGVTPDNANKADGGLHDTFAPEALIDDVMFYWAKRKVTTAMRLYSETFNKKTQNSGIDRARSPVPIWVTQGKHEFTKMGPEILQTKYDNLLNVSSLEIESGHFLAMQLPQVYSENVLTALKAFIDWHLSNKA
ncbi:alpha/beta hydrolase fold domain-containing protein [Phthorimaea operculella]|nr:alpha/beta hydrolase fold domain-containing protein [Phthorimaea operculella]